MATYSIILAGKSHGQRSLVGYSPWGGKKSDMTEHMHVHTKGTTGKKQCKDRHKIACPLWRTLSRTFHAKMGSIKNRNGMDLTEADDIKKRWQEYTEELYKKDLNDQDNHDGVITHLEPDILKCEVKWAL